MNIRIPTPDAPAAHHLTFICAVADLAHRAIERITGLQVSLQVSLYPTNNLDRHAGLVQAAADADLPYDQADDTGWHEWRSGDSYHIAAVTVFSHLPAEPAPEDDAELRQIVTTEYEAAEQPVRMCANPGCLNVADPSDTGTLCLQHAVEQYAAGDLGAEGVTVAERLARR